MFATETRGKGKRFYLKRLLQIQTILNRMNLMWDALICDLKLIEVGYDIYFAIDFSEVFRYLNPLLDRLRWKIGPGQYDMYVYEQTALKHLFEINNCPLIFLREYLEEYYHHMKRAKSIYDEYKKLDIKTLKESHYIKRLKSMLKKGLLANRNPKARMIYQELTENFLHLLAPSEFKKELLEARLQFEDLQQRGKLVYLNQMKGILLFKDKIFPEEDEEFEELVKQLNNVRSDYEKIINNETDAKAIIVTKILSNLNKRQKKLVFLMTNTLSIFEVDMNVKISLYLDKQKIEIPIVRDLYYYLLQVYYFNLFKNKSISMDDIINDIERRRKVLYDIEKLTDNLIKILFSKKEIDIDEIQYKIEDIYIQFMDAVSAIKSVPELLLLKEEIIQKVREFSLETFFSEIDIAVESENLNDQLEELFFFFDEYLSYLERKIESLEPKDENNDDR